MTEPIEKNNVVIYASNLDVPNGQGPNDPTPLNDVSIYDEGCRMMDDVPQRRAENATTTTAIPFSARCYECRT